MDVASYLRCFEESLTSYSGDDPLDAWDKFVDFLEQRLPMEGSSEMSLVFDALVLKFLNVDRYANDIRYINYCIRCASYYSDPIALYTHIFSKGVGTRTAALYVAWAQQFEQRGMNEQADSLYQKALENQVQPADIVLHEYRQFQSRTRTQPPPSGARVPLQNSQLTNQMCPHTLAQNKAAADCPSEPLGYRTVITVSRSETSGTLPSSQSTALLTVSQYNKDELVCEGSEFCFEEVRAAKYFRKIRKKQEQEQREIMERKLREQEEEVQRLQSMLEHVNQGLEACGALPSLTLSQEPSAAPTSSNPFQSSSSRPRSSNHLSSRLSLGLRLHSELNLIQEAAPSPSTAPISEVSHPSPILFNRRSGATAAGTEPGSSAQQASSIKQTNLFLTRPAAAQVHLGSDAQQTSELSTKLLEGSQLPEPEEKLNVSQGGTANLSHVTPNTSLGFVQATPSRVLPSPTVNTREALGVIMDMFQAPTFLDKPYESTSMLYHAAEKDLDVETSVISSLPKPSACAQFSIFQDDEDKENSSAAALPEKSKPGKALAEISAMKADKPNETPSELIPDESTMWGTRYNSLNSLAACPNSTTDFAMLAQFVSTPFTHKTPFSGIFFQAEENNGDSCDGDENVFTRRQTKKLSPIMEQSPSDDKASESAVSQLLPSSARQGTIMSDGFTSTSISMVQPPPPAVLSFRDQTLCPTESSRSAGSGWEVYTDPEQPPRLACQSSVRLRSEPFKILEDPEKPASPEPVQNPVCDVPMSPECAPKASWLNIRSPEATAEQDLDAFLSPCRPSKVDTSSTRTLDVPMSPEPLQFCVDTPMSSQRISDEPMMSPDRKLRTSGEIQLVSDPWDTELISDLLSKLSMPLTSHPCCITWPCDLPSIGPKMTLSMGKTLSGSS
ncbi:hypothetical protein ILYODFUR_029372 [Ilyodon furcidens]|uniref:BUB1 N-terminal domain-containing protein n=1 Tax=Ilyodon furcidens TaxID=33524 RepID=A0ABV0TZ31_9TELE